MHDYQAVLADYPHLVEVVGGYVAEVGLRLRHRVPVRARPDPRRPRPAPRRLTLAAGSRPELSEVGVEESRLADEAAGAAGRHQLTARLVVGGRGEQHREPRTSTRQPAADLETVVVTETDVQEHGLRREALDGIQALAAQPASATTV